MGFGRSLELFFVDGTPTGLLTARVFNWTGQVLRVRRLQLDKAKARSEARFAGVYFLLGEKDGQTTVYVGESEDIWSRIYLHHKEKPWWETTIWVTTAANELNKAHVRFLESRLVQLAKKAGNVAVENGNEPAPANLSEAGRANMEEFLDVLQLVLPAIGHDFLTDYKKAPDPQPNSYLAPPVPFRLEAKKAGFIATADFVGGLFVVKAGSQARQTWTGVETSSQALRNKLEAQGVIDAASNPAVFKTDYAFTSASAAAAVCQGRSANGRIEWRHLLTGQTFGDWQDAASEISAP